MGHSNQVREFVITNEGIKLMSVEFGPEGILTGTARKSNAFHKRISELNLQNELQRKDREIERKRKVLEATISNLKNEFESVEEELNSLKKKEQLHKSLLLNGEDVKSKKKK
jgi:circadian clock protein KaiC